MTSKRRGLPVRLQIVALIVATQLLATGATIFTLRAFLGDGVGPNRVATELLGPLTTLTHAHDALPASTGEQMVAAVADRDQRFTIATAPVLLAPETLFPPGRFYLDALADDFTPERFGVVAADLYRYWPFSMVNYGAAMRLAPDRWLIFMPATDSPARALPLFVLFLLPALLTLPLSALLFWASGTVTTPLKALARAADRFSHDLAEADVPVRGSREMRTAARAFNAMRANLKALMDAKSQTLAAIGHDLRTPLTRMRLRLESTKPAARVLLLRDVKAMEAMVQSALSYIRDGESAITRRAIDLSALTQAVCDDVVDAGHECAFEGPARLTISADPMLLRRALTNIIQNGITYGEKVTVTLTKRAESAELCVADLGPGINAAQHDVVFEPFFRADRARGRAEDTGFGLGLTIARAIVARHGGTIALSQNRPTGLLVTITLPRPPPRAEC